MLIQIRAAFLYYKAGQMVLQSRAGVTKWNNFCHKDGQLLQGIAVEKANEKNGGGQKILATDSLLHT